MSLSQYDPRFIEDAQNLLSRKPAVKEAVVRQALVLRLLHALGYNIWNVDEVMPEETDSAKGRADFIIRKGIGKFVIETKPSDGRFTNKELIQVYQYLVSNGIRHALLTNGKEWIFFDEELKGKTKDREIFRLDILSQPEIFEEFIVQLLSPDVWSKDIFLINSALVKEKLGDIKQLELLTEKYLPIAEDFQNNNEIKSLEKAVPLAIDLGILPKTAFDILVSKKLPKKSNDEILFHYKKGKVDAKSIYNPITGHWVVLAGSIGLSRLAEYGNTGLSTRRKVHKAEGKIVDLGDGTIKFLHDIVCTSASTALQEVIGQHRSGWKYWLDSDGNRALKYKPAGKLRNIRHIPPPMAVEED